MRISKPSRIQVLLAVGMLLWIPFMFLEDLLVKMGVLNCKDLFVPSVAASASTLDHLLNAWNWDIVQVAFGVAGVGCFVAMVVMVIWQRVSNRERVA